MQDQEFIDALEAVAVQLLRRADALSGDDMMEPCHLVLTNAATGVLIALNVLSKARPSAIEAPTAPSIPVSIADRAILSHRAV
ncbi:hypothetical protein [Methylobacterium sp. WL116]|uniref:hypothetical protein n=1 Tax=Methylobacterium sp. WL116 TaxID=2603889 RepID=UPI0011C9E994|nr:hypothetical protein [Methylobacterium sp. WL116]TXM91968.1 hypothetical protein FV223_13430 [Methylobacterium sp. WL116]